ncbi:hypothetical protein JTE90_020793 [Oedothorax gibbosus]|uniref:Glucose-methanol-choline oxidoreductase N-terminal domain-containing protein n=1 Tax=Oedothorax gibbosus TaxID=931172 RepID=A0AAV6TTD7_9ARAC|nr:hypothetical protein JTE90_020793 [Oedothorax gibbosus]
MDFLTVLSNNAYPTPFTNNPILPLLLISLAQQRHAPRTTDVFANEYDYVIVGAGSAGSVVASRLSEVPCVSVLLLEAGKSPPLLTEVPGIRNNFWFTDIDWAYKTVPQKHSGFGLMDNQVIWPGGKGLGGSSMMNGMVYVRGNKKNYDDWARQGAVGWSYSDVKPYFLKLEDNRDSEFLKNGYHVVGGPISVEKGRYEAEIKKPLIEAGKLLGYKLGDPNGRRQTGFYDTQGTLRNGQRCSTAKGYLVPAENRTNLHIVTIAYVKKILIEEGRAVGVQFDHCGLTRTVRAGKEVILSAGAVNSAQLLMLSGIGPRKHLEDLDIPVVADLPVGNNLQDHLCVPVHFEIDPNITSVQKKVMSRKSAEDYIDNRTGIFAAFSQIVVFGNAKRPSVAVDNPDFELLFYESTSRSVKVNYGLKPEVYDQMFRPFENSTMCTCLATIMTSHSKGTVRLQSYDPYDMPLIDPNYYGDTKDLKNVVAGMKACIKIVSSAPMKKLKAKVQFGSVPGCEKLSGDPYLECVARTIIITNHHPVGTAKMGNPSDPCTVVDPQLRVKSVDNLRVVDASIMPIIPWGNTNTPTIMVAEKASDIIKSTIDCYAQTPV